jgi:hypothetical protein
MNKKANVGVTIILFLFAIALLIGAILNNKDKNVQDEKNSQSIQSIKEQISPYGDKDQMNKLIIVSGFDNTTKLSKPENLVSNKISKTIIVNGTITKGYLYVVASADNKALQTSEQDRFDDIYINLIELKNDNSSKEYGGHLIENRSLETPKSNSQTELLFSLANIPYLKTYTDSDKEIISGNWLKILDESPLNKTVAFSSTLKKGTIKELSIYYTCLENTDCSLSLKE